jgi:integrase/recombinase XerD
MPNLLAMWDNKHTKALYYRMLKIILQQIGKGNLISGIRVSNPKPSVNHADLITDTEYDSLLRACKSDRERAIIEILFNTGCRASELLNIDIRDIELVDDMLLLTLNGKTGRRTIPVVSDSVPNFLYYIAAISEGRVFPMFYQHLYEMIVDIFKRTSVPKRKRAIHIFRHSRATALAQTMPEPLL